MIFESKLFISHVCLLQDLAEQGIQTRLYFHIATKAIFKTYTVVAENSIAVTTHEVELVQSKYSEPRWLSG